MTPTFEVISVPFMFGVNANCYLLKAGDGFVLIDTGVSRKRAAVEQALVNAGCQPGDLKLIILTHGDPDHAGNAAYLRDRYGAKIVMHRADEGIVQRGDMSVNRQVGWGSRLFLRILTRAFRFERFTPDGYLAEGDDLSVYGLDAQVVGLPGHSQGSIGILAGDGDLFCGDLLANTKQPDLWDIMPDPAAAEASVTKLKGLAVKTVYPGHGDPFPMAALASARE